MDLFHNSLILLATICALFCLWSAQNPNPSPIIHPMEGHDFPNLIASSVLIILNAILLGKVMCTALVHCGDDIMVKHFRF